MPATTIAAIRATPATVPLEAPLLHSNGAHWGGFVRTVLPNPGYAADGHDPIRSLQPELTPRAAAPVRVSARRRQP